MQYVTYNQYLEYLKVANILQLKEEEELYELENNYDRKKVQEIEKKHDKMFRNILSIKKEMAKFINQFLDLKKEIKENELIQCKSDFITKDYRNRQSDIVYKIKEKPIYFLVEHQSSVDKDMILGMWEYVGEIMRRESIAKKDIYPIVIPIVIYTGYKKWTSKENMKDKQYQLKDYKEYYIDFKYNLIEVQNYTFEELIEKNSLFGNIMLIEKCRKKEEIENIMNPIIKKIQDEKERKIMIEIIKNIIEPSIGKEKTEEMIEKLERKEENRMSPFTKCLLDLEIKYKKEGLKEGIKEGIKQAVENMLKFGEPEDKIMKCMGISKEELDNIKSTI